MKKYHHNPILGVTSSTYDLRDASQDVALSRRAHLKHKSIDLQHPVMCLRCRSVSVDMHPLSEIYSTYGSELVGNDDDLASTCLKWKAGYHAAHVPRIGARRDETGCTGDM